MVKLDHSGFNTSVNSTRVPLAILNPVVGNVFQFSGWLANKVAAKEVGRITNRGPFSCMKLVARRLPIGVRKPLTRLRKYQTRLGSLN